jgi:hypothetical protein
VQHLSVSATCIILSVSTPPLCCHALYPLMQVWLAEALDAAEAQLSRLCHHRALRAYNELFTSQSFPAQSFPTQSFPAQSFPAQSAATVSPWLSPAYTSSALGNTAYHFERHDTDGGTGGVIPISSPLFGVAHSGIWSVGSGTLSNDDALISSLLAPTSSDASLEALLCPGSDCLQVERSVLLAVLESFRALYRSSWNLPFTREVLAHASNICVGGPGDLCPDLSLTGPHREQVTARSAIVLALARRAFNEYQLQLVDPLCIVGERAHTKSHVSC